MEIRTKEDLRYCLKADDARYKVVPKWWWSLVFDDNRMLYNCIRNMRYLNYYRNNRHWYNYPLYLYHYLRYRRYALKYYINITTTDVGPGFRMVHPGFLYVYHDCHIGSNVTILPNVLIGRKSPTRDKQPIFIGDNVYIGTNVTILGPVHIGNHVTIAAGSVVIKDIPDNCMVAGNPAVIKKHIKH